MIYGRPEFGGALDGSCCSTLDPIDRRIVVEAVIADALDGGGRVADLDKEVARLAPFEDQVDDLQGEVEEREADIRTAERERDSARERLAELLAAVDAFLASDRGGAAAGELRAARDEAAT